MKITRMEPTETETVFIALTRNESELLIGYLGRTYWSSTEKILEDTKFNVSEVNELLYQLYDKLFTAGVVYARD